MAMTPNGFLESDPAALKKELELASKGASRAHFNHAVEHGQQGIRDLSSSFKAALRAAHSTVAIGYRNLGRILHL